jgi:hypothetical protein
VAANGKARGPFNIAGAHSLLAVSASADAGTEYTIPAGGTWGGVPRPCPGCVTPKKAG